MSRDPSSFQADLSRAKARVLELRSATRRGIAALVLTGKSLKSLKRKLGFTHGGDRSPERQIAGPGKTWDQLCREELGIDSETARRWIKLHDAAIERAKRHKKTEPEALRLLSIPDDELDGNELEALASCVDRLVDGDTQAGLLYELGIVRGGYLRPGGASPPRTKDEITLEFVSRFFISGFTATAESLKKASKFIGDCDFDAYLYQLPLVGIVPEDGSTPVIGLQGLKAALEDIRAKFHDAEQRLAETVKKTEAAIEANMIPVGPKSRPRKAKTKEGNKR